VEILELINTMTEIQNLLDGLNSRMGTKQERVSELEDRSKGIIQSKQKEKKRWDKIKRASEALGSLTKGLTFMSLESKKKGERVK